MWFFYLYLRLALLFGFYRHVCRLVNRWREGVASKNDSFRKQAACRMQNILFERGYPHCPSCYWPVVKKDDHEDRECLYCWDMRGAPSGGLLCIMVAMGMGKKMGKNGSLEK